MMKRLGLLFIISIFQHVGGCSTSLGCSLNGDCVVGVCHCSRGWKGEQCELLVLAPAPPGGAYGYNPNISAWGAHVVRWTDGLYHMFVSELWGDCGISSWQRNSHVIHATANTVVGPYTYNDTALPPEATCNHLLINGSDIVMFHQGRSGDGKGGLVNCSNGSWIPPKEQWPLVAPNKVHTSNSGPAGPWLKQGNMPDFICNNPSPLLLLNGSVALFCHGPGIRIVTAPGVSGPWSSARFILEPNEQPIPHTVWEDPFVWLDRLGHWHLLSHVYPTNTTNWLQYADIVAGHAYSIDGVAWHFHPTPPYTASVQGTDGALLHYATRERPFLLLTEDSEKVPLALFTSVTLPGRPKQNKSAGGDYSFTHVQPIGGVKYFV